VKDAEIEGAVLEALYTIAPEAQGEPLDPAVNFRDQLDIDSMDFLNFLVAVGESLGVEVPESDYADVSTLAGCVAYLKRRLPRE
jgi:acyl carrier protein